MKKRPGVQSDPAVSEYVRKRIVDLWDNGNGKTLDDIARMLEVTRTTIISVREGRKGVGTQLENRAAALWFGGSLDRLRHAAHGGENLPSPSTEYVELDPEEVARANGELVEPDAETPTPGPVTDYAHVAVPKIRNLPYYSQLDSTSRVMRPDIPEWPRQRLGDANMMMDAPLDIAGYISLLEWTWRHTPPPSEPAPPRRRRG